MFSLIGMTGISKAVKLEQVLHGKRKRRMGRKEREDHEV